MTVLDIRLPYVTFEVACSPGTYVRTLCADSGTKLACGAHLVELTRLQSGNFHLADAINLNQLRTTTVERQWPAGYFVFTLRVIQRSTELTVGNDLFTLLKKRRTLAVSHVKNTSPATLNKGDFVKVTCQEDSLIALVQSLIGTTATVKLPETRSELGNLFVSFNPHENTLH